MTDRKLAYIVKNQKPLVMREGYTVQHACKLMWERRAGTARASLAPYCLDDDVDALL